MRHFRTDGRMTMKTNMPPGHVGKKRDRFIHGKDKRVMGIALMIAFILGLNYFTHYAFAYEHALYRVLFYLPLVLGTLWFSLRGAIIISLSILLLYLPYGFEHWEGFSIEDFHVLCEALVYVFIALILGFQVRKSEKEHEALVKAESLSAIGTTVVEVAHDMKAPLVAIGGFARQVSGKLDDDDPNKGKLEIVVNETGRLETMVRDMLDYGKPIELQLTESALNDVVSEVVEMAEPLASERGVEVILDLSSSVSAVALDVHRFKQVILNLLTNAIQASSEGSQVRVSTRLTDNREIELDVTDAGSGIEKKDWGNVFQPFFSTKRKGTGLGLPIVKKIVEAHGGSIEFFSNKNKGVTFRVRLPL